MIIIYPDELHFKWDARSAKGPGPGDSILLETRSLCQIRPKRLATNCPESAKPLLGRQKIAVVENFFAGIRRSLKKTKPECQRLVVKIQPIVDAQILENQ